MRLGIGATRADPRTDEPLLSL